MAVGSGDADVLQGTIAIAATWNAATRSWTDVSPKISQCGQAACAWASVISCGSQKICLTLGHAGGQVWDGQSWEAAPTIAVGPASGLPAVSCGLTFCMAVGHQKIHGVRHSLTELWDGNGVDPPAAGRPVLTFITSAAQLLRQSLRSRRQRSRRTGAR